MNIKISCWRTECGWDGVEIINDSNFDRAFKDPEKAIQYMAHICDASCGEDMKFFSVEVEE